MTEPDYTLTFDSSATEFIVEAFGYAIDEHGLVVDDEGQPVRSYLGDPIPASEFAGVAERDGEPVPIRSDFVELSHLVTDGEPRRADA